ncbi:PTS transporter subunit EIIB [Cellulomonas chengniuliangii]|uniref:PTS transporter subunit EIIB n=1 Tax=Cellulomonas chengniuliangii TaxID=2968084 RepID=A0ABY5L4G4_9CELL|nr:PTS transporter subunit EIIB [Cellulomonas chengniuliangii]MCC2309884.1 PTS transporter subunit EIIB [Cellulomonas chengniuliangii]MCC2318143.1 PTS transporter subunit EIIB [Cellulomonas chengniuliangii]UUI76918.1 PTS transporter subunit EIIB [Cellulomonas chengniuliangii]
MHGPRSQREQAAAILAALGGIANIDEIEPCTTRLRSLVKSPGRVDAAALRAAGAYGVMISGRVVQVVVGPGVDTLASDLEDLM